MAINAGFAILVWLEQRGKKARKEESRVAETDQNYNLQSLQTGILTIHSYTSRGQIRNAVARKFVV
jgi:hypothetical protein